MNTRFSPNTLGNFLQMVVLFLTKSLVEGLQVEGLLEAKFKGVQLNVSNRYRRVLCVIPSCV
jgi:hypothetical protein